MRPVIVAWLVRHGWPAWFAPSYVTMVGFSTLIAAILVLRQAEKDRADVSMQARAIICAYLGAMLGGYLFEWIRAIPVAIERGSLAPILFAGRAAYGGLIFGAIAPVLYLRYRRKTTSLDFLDRATLGMGIVFACVRFGCFLEGCDFGRTTASFIGVRFPAGSPAADAHRALGFIPANAPSLPVHPTELYESCVGLVATGVAWIPLRKGRRDGAAFATWLVTYAIGRFLLELLRGDVDRGRYAALSTAQWVSIAILAAVLGGVLVQQRARERTIARAVAAALLVIVSLFGSDHDAYAQPRQPSAAQTVAPAAEPLPQLPPEAPPAQPQTQPQPVQQPNGETVVFVPPPAFGVPASAAHKDKKKEATPWEPPPHQFELRASLISSFTMARPDVPSGWAGELDAMFRLRLGKRTRFGLGLEGRRFENTEAIHYSIGLIGELAIELGRHFELTGFLVPHHTWFSFKSDFFSGTNAYGFRYGMGAQIPIDHVIIGFTPVAFTTTSSTTVGVISQWEPRLWVGVAF